MAAARISRAFAGPRKGETAELRGMLVSQYAWERKEGIQKVIMAMTLGKDVSQLFPDVLKNIATGDLDQKKLVYLYLMNYAKSHPDLCILAVNTFVQDSEDSNPLIRALAIRTMGCVRVDKMVDYMTEPLRKTLSDESPYVRKTAAICVAKLFDLNPAMCLDEGFLEKLQELMGDPNPMVIANAVTALAEIGEAAPETHALVITGHSLKKMLMALNECTEWGRITILTRLAEYTAQDVKESEHICERVSPQFQHVNPSVVLSAIKVVFLHMRYVSQELAQNYLKKMAPPLVTLVSTPPEVQYVALRNIDLILQKEPNILSKELRVFFIKYNDPAYIKFQKLEIMVRLANEKNVDQLLAELKEYALEVDVDIVKRATKAIGQVAIKIEDASEKCVNTLLDLINTKVNYVVQEVIVVIKDVFRKYPGYEGIIPQLCQCIDDLDDANARGSIIWIVGEYAEKITNAGDILAGFVDAFVEEFTQTQLQIITAVVKLFLKKPNDQQAQQLVQRIFQVATNDNDNPDVRDRAYVYWRLLSSNAQIAQNVVLSDKPPIESTIASLPRGLLDQLTHELSTLASVYHKPAETFVGHGKYGADAVQRAAIEEQMQNARENPLAAEAIAKAVSGGTAHTPQNNVENLLDIDFDGGAPASMQKTPAPGLNGLEGLGGTPQRMVSPAPGTNGMAHPPPQQQHVNALDDLMGLGGDLNGSADGGPAMDYGGIAGGGSQDILSGFAGLELGPGASSQPPPPQTQLSSSNVPTVESTGGGTREAKKSSQDLLDLF